MNHMAGTDVLHVPYRGSAPAVTDVATGAVTMSFSSLAASLPLIEDGSLSGTTPAGLVRAIAELSGGALAAIPYARPWSPRTLSGLFDVLGGLQRPVTVVANVATRQLWGSRPSAAQLLAYLLDGKQEGPAADWDCGHFCELALRWNSNVLRSEQVRDTHRLIRRRSHDRRRAHQSRPSKDHQGQRRGGAERAGRGSGWG